MIVACDLFCWGSEHVGFNAGMLEVVLSAFPHERLGFFGEPSHIKLVREQMGSLMAGKVSWTPVQIPDRQAPYLQRVRLEKKIFSDVFADLAASTDLVLLLTVTPATLLAFNLSRRQLRKEIPVQGVMHGILSGIGTKRSLHPLRRGEDIRTAMTVWGRRNYQYLVLEDSIKDTLLQYLPFLSGKVEVLEHPLSPNETASEGIALEPPIRFGFLGLANQQKGFPRFAKLASEMIDKYPGLAEFHALGMDVEPAEPGPYIEALAKKPARQHLERNAYVAGVKQLHYTVFPYQSEHYALCASGTLVDALACEKPIIASRIPLFENMFRKHGNVGFLFESQRELKQIVESIATKGVEPSLYAEQILNIRQARAARAPTVLAETYRKICDNAFKLSGLTVPGNKNSHVFVDASVHNSKETS